MPDQTMIRKLRNQITSTLKRRTNRRPAIRSTSTRLVVSVLEDRTVPTTFSLVNATGLSSSQGFAWVAGFNGGGANGLQPTGGGQGTFSATTQAFYQIGDGPNQINSITFNSGGGRLIFVVSLTQPPTMSVGQGLFTPPPYPSLPATLPTGPQDIFEFSFNGNDNLSAVQGFGLNLYISDPSINESYGVPTVSRAQIGKAYTQFMQNDPLGADYAKLLYNAPANSTIQVPLNQFFAIADPFDWVNVNPTDSLSTFWDATLTRFFQNGNYLSINLNAGSQPNIYSGQCVNGTYTLSNGVNTYAFANPGTGLPGAVYVFGQQFATTPAPDQGLLQDNIWQALCRGVALDGVSTTPISNGESTTAWNSTAKWYTQHASTAFPSFQSVYNAYAKFLHYSTASGMDGRIVKGTPIFAGNSAYAFSEDENPNGPYSGGQVPSKTIQSVGPNDTLTITLGPWVSSHAPFAVGSGDGGAPHVKVFEPVTGRLIHELAPYASAFLGGVRTSVADVNGDGSFDIITGAGSGGGPHVRIFDGATGDPLAGVLGSFMAFDLNFRGGVYVEGGDVDGDGFDDVVVSAGEGGGPHVKAFSGRDGSLIANFMAFDPSFRGGARVAVGDVNGDGRNDIIVSAGPGGGPHVRVFDGATGAQIAGPSGSFMAFDLAFRGGVFVAGSDLDGDGITDVIVSAGDGGGPHVKAFRGRDHALLISFMAYDILFSGGVRIDAKDVNGDGRRDIVTSAGPGGGPHVRAFNGLNAAPIPGDLASFMAFNPAFRGGVYVG